MWAPEPGWQPLSFGQGPSTVGVWVGQCQGQQAVLKRLGVPSRFDPPQLRHPDSPHYWRREADLLLDGALSQSRGIRPAPLLRVDEDKSGISIVSAWVNHRPTSGLFLARQLGTFATSTFADRSDWATNHLQSRLESVAERGGWQTLTRTTAADVAEHLWQFRHRHLDKLAKAPATAAFGDATPHNLLATEAGELVGVDWATVGKAPIGFDAGYLALSVPEDFGSVVSTYWEGWCARHSDSVQGRAVSLSDVAYAASVVAVYTVLTRADWALLRVVEGAGPLAAKFRHPAVAPHLKMLQRLTHKLRRSWRSSCYKLSVANVSQAFMLPCSNPIPNQRWRCSAEP
jgi:hypothetical protein